MDPAVGTTLSQSLSAALGEPTLALASAVNTTNHVAVVSGSWSWVGLFARLTLGVLRLVSTVLYWVLKLTTFSFPTLLFTLFSTSLTVTMNATTLWVAPFHSILRG